MRVFPKQRIIQKRASPIQLWNLYFGNLFEHYDTALFGLLSVPFSTLFFPEKDPLTALILTFAILPIGQLARPIGSLVFGLIGDHYGRMRALFLSLMGMSIVTGLIAFTPTYQSCGIFAPILLGLGRVFQNFFAAGETMGGGIFLLENSPERNHDFLSGFFSTSTIGGYLLASLGVFLIASLDILEGGWRALYLVGCTTALFGGWMRRNQLVPTFPGNLKDKLKQLKKTLIKQKRELFFIAVVAGFSSATFSFVFILLNGVVPLISKVSSGEILRLSTYFFLLDFLFLPLFGWVSAKVSREKMMIVAASSIFFLSTPLIQMLEGATLGTVIPIRTLFILFGVSFAAPFYSWAQQLIPKNSRYTVLSFGYALGCLLFGSPAVVGSLWLYKKTGMIESITWYWMGLALASIVILSRQLSHSKLERSHDY